MFNLIWKGEIIKYDIDTYPEAETLKNEYNQAYNGGVSIGR